MLILGTARRGNPGTWDIHYSYYSFHNGAPLRLHHLFLSDMRGCKNEDALEIIAVY